MTSTTIRAVLPSHEAAWRSLWRDHCNSLRLSIPASVSDRTWSRILDPDSALSCVVAEQSGRLVGFAHCVVHEDTREVQPVCFVEDLYVHPAARRQGVGLALVDWLRNAMRAEGWSSLYWFAGQDDAAAQALSAHFGGVASGDRFAIRR